jgi:Trp operon repressor
VSAVLELLDRAHRAHRREAVQATVALLDELLARDRRVRDVRIKPGLGVLTVTVGDATIRLAMPSAAQSRALRELHRRGPVVLAMGLALDDGRAMLGFSGVDEDVLISTRVSWGVTGLRHCAGAPDAAAT